MGKVTEELIKKLEELIQLLDSQNQSHWIQWFSRCHKILVNSDYSGIPRILGAYGGMGSFNDLVLTKKLQNGNTSLCPDENDILDKLRSSIGDKANYIKQNHEIDS